MITICLKDGKEKEFESAVSLADAAKAISNSLGKNALVAKVNGELTDLRDPIVDGAEVEFFTSVSHTGQECVIADIPCFMHVKILGLARVEGQRPLSIPFLEIPR